MSVTEKQHGNKGRKRPDLTERNKQNYTHKLSNTSTYTVWRQMKNRCLKKDNKDYERYGARGISICKDWLKFENFVYDMGERPAGLQLDRINNNGNYEKNNCRWVTPKENCNNRRSSRFIEYNGEIKTIIQWAKEFNICSKVLMYRLKANWPLEKVFNIKPDRSNRLEKS